MRVHGQDTPQDERIRAGNHFRSMIVPSAESADVDPWQPLSWAWQRAYELRIGAVMDEDSVASATTLISNVLAMQPVDEVFAEQQDDLRRYSGIEPADLRQPNATEVAE